MKITNKFCYVMVDVNVEELLIMQTHARKQKIIKIIIKFLLLKCFILFEIYNYVFIFIFTLKTYINVS